VDADEDAGPEDKGVSVMRRMTQLTPGSQSIRMTSVFRGYNHNEVIADGEMYDMQNMSGDKYPILSLRQKRGITSLDPAGSSPVKLTGIHGRDQLVFVRGGKVYYNMAEVGGLNSLSTDPDMCPKKIVSFGAFVCIWPDKMYFNTTDDNPTLERMDRVYSISGSSVTVNMCRGDGSDMSNIDIQDEPPEDPQNGALWIDTSGDNDVLKQWIASSKEWLEVATTFVKIGATGIGAGLKEYDVVEISGMEAGSGVTDPKVVSQIDALNGSMIVYYCDDDYIVVAGLISESQAALKSQTVRADILIPDLDFICESNNRLWGCKYGLGDDGEVLNEIRATKLGDFRNWECYMGLSTDSYAASVGTDGPFTGAITQRGYPVFFKENCIHRVSGMSPSSFQIQTTICRGVQRGSWRSLAVVNENIYYKARNAVMVYDGNMPESVSSQLGDILYSSARGGVLGNKYYISMCKPNGDYVMFNYDTKTGVWYKEDAVVALGFASVADELYYIDENENTLVTVRGTMGTIENDFDWAAEFDLFGTTYIPGGNSDSPVRVRNNKYLSMFKIRMYLDPDAHMKLWIKYNDAPIYELMGERHGSDLRTFVLPVIPKRCDHIRFKITGHGDAKIYDISRMLEVGGDG